MFRVEITNTDTAAFELEGGRVEIGRILRRLATEVERTPKVTAWSAPLLDFNGNRVGFAWSGPEEFTR